MTNSCTLPAMPERIKKLKKWLTDQVGLPSFSLEPASGDASFRRYFRVMLSDKSYIAMDAPPDKEDCRPFVAIARQLKAVGLNVPSIHAENLEQGFLLLDDFGSTLYLDILNPGNADQLYADAIVSLVQLQSKMPTAALPPYNRVLLMQEMELFREWLLQKHLGLSLTDNDHALLTQAFELLANSALEQPQVAVHRDYHSRNLMLTDPNPGILDFQDAVNGPVTYDLVSLLRDCYIQWPAGQVETWAMIYFKQAVKSGVLLSEYEEKFPQWFDLMGVQRHLKAAGIFTRLHCRDGKSGYLKDIPRTLGYIVKLAPRYARLQGLAEFITRRVLPGLAA
ncbi:MAG: phosphotransferase [Candidatus Polarisedimenticolaceae bacterium]|nr:phosphotransferase [Candidatus Polarisedimenticolaceae bacterium]